MKKIYLISLLLSVFSCTENKEDKVTIVEIEPSKIISQLDTLFFTNVAIFGDEERNYILNRRPAFLAATDKEFNLLWVRNKEGDGPSDLSFPEQGISDGNIVYVLDHGNLSIKQFDSQSGRFIASTKVSEPFMKFRFDQGVNGYSYLSVFSPGENASVIQTDKNGQVKKRIGALFPERDGPNRQMKYFQLDNKKNIILIGASLPYIEIMDKEGNSINRFDIGEYEPIKRALDSLQMDIIKGERINSNSIPSIIKDAQYSNGKLFVSFTDRIGTDRTNARNLLQFKIDNENCILETIFKFKTGTEDDDLHPGFFYIDPFLSKLYIQGLITNQIYVFELPD